MKNYKVMVVAYDELQKLYFHLYMYMYLQINLVL